MLLKQVVVVFLNLTSLQGEMVRGLSDQKNPFFLLVIQLLHLLHGHTVPITEVLNNLGIAIYAKNAPHHLPFKVIELAGLNWRPCKKTGVVV
jgi:hypothetical protein